MRAIVEINLNGTGIDYLDKRAYDAVRDHFTDAVRNLATILNEHELDAEVKYAEDGGIEWIYVTDLPRNCPDCGRIHTAGDDVVSTCARCGHVFAHCECDAIPYPNGDIIGAALRQRD